METKKLGILVPFYRHAEYLKEALDSYLNQTYAETYVYTLDDKSPDDNETWKQLKQYSKEHKGSKLRCAIQNPVNIGCFRSYNYLASLAIKDGCDYILPCGGDDKMHETCIEEAIKLFTDEIKCVDIPCKTFGLNDTTVFWPQPSATYETAWNQNPFTSFMIYTSELWNYYNGYDTSITPSHIQTGIEDCEFHLRLLRDKVKIAFLSLPLYYYRVHENQSHHHAQPYLDELYKIIRQKHGV